MRTPLGGFHINRKIIMHFWGIDGDACCWTLARSSSGTSVIKLAVLPMQALKQLNSVRCKDVQLRDASKILCVKSSCLKIKNELFTTAPTQRDWQKQVQVQKELLQQP